MASLRLENVTKRFDRVVAVKHMSLDMRDGEFMVLLGPTGAGKTTTLRTIAGLERPEEGRIYIDWIDVTTLTPAERDVAFVFQYFALYPHFTVYENLAFPLKPRGFSHSEIDARINQVSRILHIEHLLARMPSKLSGGEMQRVALGRAMVRDARVYLMDEPLSNLDAKLREEMRAELKRIQKDLGATILFVTHDQIEAMSMGDRIAVMVAGEIQQLGTPDEVYNRPRNLFVAGFVGSPGMNFLDCEYERDRGPVLDVGPGIFALMLGPQQQEALSRRARGRRFTLGIRPEDIIVRTDGVDDDGGANGGKAPGLFRTDIYLVQYMGSYNIVNFKVGDKLVRARTLPSFRGGIGDRVWVGVASERIHIFEGDGQREAIL